MVVLANTVSSRCDTSLRARTAASRSVVSSIAAKKTGRVFIRQQLEGDGNIIVAAVLTTVNCFKMQNSLPSRSEGLNHFTEALWRHHGLDIEGRHFAQLVHRITEVVPGSAVHQDKFLAFPRQKTKVSLAASSTMRPSRSLADAVVNRSNSAAARPANSWSVSSG